MRRVIRRGLRHKRIFMHELSESRENKAFKIHEKVGFSLVDVDDGERSHFGLGQ